MGQMTTTHLQGKNKNKSVSIPKSPLQENNKEDNGFRKGMKTRTDKELEKIDCYCSDYNPKCEKCKEKSLGAEE